jgi:hypothetical protein
MDKEQAAEAFTKIIGNLLTDARDLVDWGIESGHTTPDKLRLTVEARREQATKLVESGMSQRQAAKALGVSKSALNRDVSQSGTKVSQSGTQPAKRDMESVPEQAAPPPIKPPGTSEIVVAAPAPDIAPTANPVVISKYSALDLQGAWSRELTSALRTACTCEAEGGSDAEVLAAFRAFAQLAADTCTSVDGLNVHVRKLKQ